MTRENAWWLMGVLFWSLPGFAESIQLATPRASTDGVPTILLTDVRPAWQKKKEILSLWRTSCDFAIVRWGDKDLAPSPAQTVSEGLGRYLDGSFLDRAFRLTWFTLHQNSRAPASNRHDPMESGLVADAIHSMECRKGAEMIGGVGDNEAEQPAPFVVDIVVEVDGQSFSGRAVKSVADTNIATVQLMDQALARLAKSIAERAPTPTPCQRLKAARDAAPDDRFYEKSYKQFCSS